MDTSRFVYGETPTPATDGSTKVFTTSVAYVSGLLEVIMDGLVQIKDTDWSETSPSAGTFTMGTAPDSDENLRINYIKAV